MSVVLVAEYPSADTLVAAGRLLGTTRIRVIETYSPEPIDALDPPASRMPLAPITAAAGIGGAIVGYLGQWLVAAYLYPIDVGGRAPHLPLAFVPIALEMAFLGAAIAVVVTFVVRARLTALWEPICDVPGFASATTDGYWLVARGEDRDAMHELLARSGARTIGDLR
jgi:hypothetical protein